MRLRDENYRKELAFCTPQTRISIINNLEQPLCTIFSIYIGLNFFKYFKGKMRRNHDNLGYYLKRGVL